MKFLCLTPLYNHHQRLTATVYQALIDQTYTEWSWILGDDRPREHQLQATVDPDPRVRIVHFSERCKSMGEKYSGMVEYANQNNIAWDAIAIMDGDDMFAPAHLAKHAETLAAEEYSRPSVVFTAVTGIVQVESSVGRFWSSVAFTKAALDRIGGFKQSRIVGFDQELMNAFKGVYGEPDHGVPTYVYRWANTASDHASGHSNGYACTEWWGKVPYQPAEGLLYPRYDDVTENFLIPAVQAEYEKRKNAGLSYA